MALGATPPRPLEPMDRQRLEARLERIAFNHFQGRTFDRLEMRYLSGLASNYFLLLADVYDEPTMERILQKEPDSTLELLHRLWDGRPPGEEKQVMEALRRIRSVPDEVRLIGEKCLYDVGMFGKRAHRGYDLPELGCASYRRASDILEDLAQDSQLRRFFRENRLGGGRIEEEITFLRQCARHFHEYAEVLSHLELFNDSPRPVTSADTDILPVGELPLTLENEEPPQASLGIAPNEMLQPSPPHELEPVVEEAEEDPEISRLDAPERLSYFERLLLFSSLDIEALRQGLTEVVIDQPEAVDIICDDFSLFATGTNTQHKPLSYFFVGPTGVGKNHLVEQLASSMEALWGREIPVLLIEGPSYTYPSDINELRGSTRGFIRSDEEGILTEFHHRASAAPFSVILVDEVEKAHSQLRKFFLSLMDRGTITDNRGTQLSFASTMLVYTSNLGYSRLQQAADPIGFSDGNARDDFRRRELQGELKRELSPEFINRLQIVHFDSLSMKSIARIYELELDRIVQRYRRYQGLDLQVSDSARAALIERGYSPEFGARFLGRVLNEVCNIQVSKKLREDSPHQDGGGRTADLLNYIQEARREERTPDMEMLQRRVLAQARARVPYRRMTVDFRGDEFLYHAD